MIVFSVLFNCLCLTIQVQIRFALFGVKCFICKISLNYTDLRCFLDLEVLAQQAKGAEASVAYCSGKSSGGNNNQFSSTKYSNKKLYICISFYY